MQESWISVCPFDYEDGRFHYELWVGSTLTMVSDKTYSRRSDAERGARRLLEKLSWMELHNAEIPLQHD